MSKDIPSLCPPYGKCILLVIHNDRSNYCHRVKPRESIVDIFIPKTLVNKKTGYSQKSE